MAKQNKMTTQNIFSLLEDGGDNYYTHVNMTGTKGKYILSYKNIDTFWKVYHESISKSINTKKYTIGLAEKPQKYMPVIADIDIKVKAHNEKGELLYPKDKPLYEDKVILAFIQTYQAILKVLVKDITPKDLDCLLLVKPPYYKKYGTSTYIKNGFHLHFPKIFLDKEDQKIFLVPKVKQTIQSVYKDLLSSIGIEDASTLVDSNIYNVCFLLYGSVKEKGMFPYLLGCIIDGNLNKKDAKESLSGYKLYDQDGEEEIVDKTNLQENLPRILSIIPYGRKINTVKLDPQLKTVRATKPKPKMKEYEEQKYSEKIDWAKRLTDILSPDRAEDYILWMQVGWALYNVSEGSDDGLMIWKEFSSQSEKYCEEKCEYEWDRMENRDITIGSLKYWALKDNPDKYSELVKDRSADYIKDHLTGSIFQGDMVKVIHQLYEGQFVCASISNQKKAWYYFNNHRWENIDCGVELWKKISNEVLYIVNATKWKEAKKMQECQDELKVQMYAKRIKLLEKLAGKLTCGTYKDRLLKDSAYMFYNKYFLEKLDNDPYIIPFQNGIYDLRNNIFREGKPEDYVSKTLPINYVEYSETDSRVEEVEEFFCNVFPDNELRQYFLAHLSEIFVGNNKKKIVYMWTGHGDNGKSVTQTLIENMMGRYAIKMPTTVITSKKPSVGAACVELARAGSGVRWAVLEEPNEDERINIGIMKNLSGNDTFFARGLYSDGGDIKPMFKLIFICNKLPDINSSDKATWNRIRVIPFESTFTRNPPEDIEEQKKLKIFPMDEDFSSKIPHMLEPLAWYLLNFRKNIKKEIFEPEKVKIATKEYREENDYITIFIDESFAKDENSIISMNEVYSLYKGWHKDNMAGACFNKKKIQQQMCRIWGQPSSPGIFWKGWKILSFEENVNIQKIDPSNLVKYEDDNFASYDNSIPI